jgi:hypothetical protein
MLRCKAHRVAIVPAFVAIDSNPHFTAGPRLAFVPLSARMCHLVVADQKGR